MYLSSYMQNFMWDLALFVELSLLSFRKARIDEIYIVISVLKMNSLIDTFHIWDLLREKVDRPKHNKSFCQILVQSSYLANSKLRRQVSIHLNCLPPYGYHHPILRKYLGVT